MKKPQPTNPEKVRKQRWSFYEQVGYNQALADVDGWLDSISVERIKGLIEQHGMYLTPELDAFSMHKSSVEKLSKAIHKLIQLKEFN
jgi:hypothetical protein